MSSYYLGAAAIVGGAGMSAYGAYQYMASCCNKDQEAAKAQKAAAFKHVAAGVAVIAIGVAGIVHGSISAENERLKAALAAAQAKAAASTCTLDRLESLVGGNVSFVDKTFKVLKDTHGISCDNFLTYKEKFIGGTDYVDGIKPEDMNQSVMWGIDRGSRPYIAVKYVCDKVSQGVTTFFQRYTDYGAQVASGDHTACPDLMRNYDLSPVMNKEETFLSNFRSFLGGNKLNIKHINNITHELQLAK